MMQETWHLMGVCKVEMPRRQPGGHASSHWGVVMGLEASSPAEGCQGGEFLGLSLWTQASS